MLSFLRCDVCKDLKCGKPSEDYEDSRSTVAGTSAESSNEENLAAIGLWFPEVLLYSCCVVFSHMCVP